MENVNEIFQQFAAAFAGDIDSGGLSGEIAFAQQLRRDRLDYSIESLRTVDDYLQYVHENTDRLDGEGWSKTVLWGGAYVGEVIRRNAKHQYDWIDYDEFMPTRPNLKDVIPERNVATCAFLCREGRMTMPMNKVARFIGEGPENNIHYYASIECSGQ